MSTFEYARREEMHDRFEREVAELLAIPTPPIGGPAILEEHADVLVQHAIALRTLAALWRTEVASA